MEELKYNPLNVDLIRFEGMRNLFGVEFENNDVEDVKLTEHVISFTQLSHTLIIVIQTTLKNQEEYCTLNTIKEYFSKNRNVNLRIVDLQGITKELRIYNNCELLDISKDTYSYLYEENDAEEVTVILKYHNNEES